MYLLVCVALLERCGFILVYVVICSSSIEDATSDKVRAYIRFVMSLSINVTSTPCFDLILSSSGTFYVIPGFYFFSNSWFSNSLKQFPIIT
jgi:hypothetical protein